MGTTYSLLEATDHWFVDIENIAEFWVFLFIKFSGIFFFPDQKTFFFYFLLKQASVFYLTQHIYERRKKLQVTLFCSYFIDQ